MQKTKFIVITQIFMMQIVLKDEPDIDPNDQNSILEHLDKVVGIGSSHWQLVCAFSAPFCPYKLL
jgi:hypothetical protein